MRIQTTRNELFGLCDTIGKRSENIMINLDNLKLVTIHTSGRVREVGKSEADGWYVLLRCGRHLRHRYIHLPGRPVVEVGQMVWDRDGMVCEEEHNG